MDRGIVETSTLGTYAAKLDSALEIIAWSDFQIEPKR